MSLVVNSNASSLNAQRNLTRNQVDLTQSLQRLSSGLRINSAKDDAAGMFSAELMTSQIKGLDVAMRNAADGVSLAQTSEGAMTEIANNLQRMREISVQAANATTQNRTGLQAEFSQLQAEIKRIGNATAFNGQKLLAGNATAKLTFQVGVVNTSAAKITVSLTKVNGKTAITKATAAALAVSAQTKAQAALATLDSAISALAKNRATLGSLMSRFEAATNQISSAVENLTASRSRIQDADFATETAKMTRAQVLQQAGVSILAQANQSPQAALSLLR